MKLTYFTGDASGTVDGVPVNGKIQLRGYIWPEGAGDWSGGQYVPSCLHGYVESKANSSIDQVSWEGWVYVNDTLEENWGSSCTNCRKGKSKSDFELHYNQGLGVYTMKARGYHVWTEDGDALHERSNVSSGTL